MPISLEHHPAIAERDYAALSRLAYRRERFLDALDWTALEEQFAWEALMTDDTSTISAAGLPTPVPMRPARIRSSASRASCGSTRRIDRRIPPDPSRSSGRAGPGL